MNLITFLNDNTIKNIRTHMYIYISGGQTLVDVSIFKHSKEILEVKYTSNLGWNKDQLITLDYKYHYYIPFGKDSVGMGYQLTVEKLVQSGISAFRDIIMDYLRDNQVRSEVISLDLDKEDLGEPVEEFYGEKKQLDKIYLEQLQKELESKAKEKEEEERAYLKMNKLSDIDVDLFALFEVNPDYKYSKKELDDIVNKEDTLEKGKMYKTRRNCETFVETLIEKLKEIRKINLNESVYAGYNITSNGENIVLVIELCVIGDTYHATITNSAASSKIISHVDDSTFKHKLMVKIDEIEKLYKAGFL